MLSICNRVSYQVIHNQGQANPNNINQALQGQQKLAGQWGNYQEKQFDGLAQFAGQMAGGMSGGKSMGQAMGDIFNSTNGYGG